MKREQSLLQIIKERAAKISIRKRKKRNLLLLAISMFLANVSWGIAYPYLGVYMKAPGRITFSCRAFECCFQFDIQA
ncbi:hypothetical protein GQS78_00005 [Thermococcus bergensis]|uniref:hypothetical protein n=1 Tax=Thermococcus bergensis TaxID=2689387 RepID=UPI001CEDCA74|nr:hypothetical protein [Thermococcus bergensis]MCA6212717.1 hypothetical protein [Thermococcus bergensis]